MITQKTQKDNYRIELSNMDTMKTFEKPPKTQRFSEEPLKNPKSRI